MKQFDWKYCKKNNNPKVYEFLWEWHEIAVSEEKFIQMWSNLRKYSRVGHRNERYAPSKGRKQYRRLKEKFGFFQ